MPGSGGNPVEAGIYHLGIEYLLPLTSPGGPAFPHALHQDATDTITLTVNGQSVTGRWQVSSNDTLIKVKMPLAAPNVQAAASGSLPPGWRISIARSAFGWVEMCHSDIGNWCAGTGVKLAPTGGEQTENFAARVNAPTFMAMEAVIEVTWTP